LTVFLMGNWGVLVRTVFYIIGGAGIAASLTVFFLNKEALLKTAFIIIIISAVFLAVFIAVGEIFRFDEYENDVDKIKALTKIIEDTGAWGMAVFFLIQVLQVVILPLPAAVCYIPGAVIWGPLTATLLASAGVLVGSVINYAIGKFWGKKAVVWIAGEETTQKYTAYLGKRGKGIFLIMQILPFFPDDILCMVAGLTSMNFAFFTLTIVLVRPLIIAAYCYLGSGTVIPFEGWGIAVWIIIFIVCIALAVLSFRYQEKVENWLVNKFSAKKKRETAETSTELEDNIPPDK
ncbi:MAG: VTT domain-containing protein, partial [Clostridia bacterium]|nr:VTT domain-containing protein [Clostridia bacterium]